MRFKILDCYYQLEFKVGNSEGYKIMTIWDSAIYAKELKLGHSLRLYYLVL